MKNKKRSKLIDYKIVRKHDILYLKENNYKNPKQVHLDLIKLIEKNIKLKRKSNYSGAISDFGCANGELIYNIRKKFKNANLYGVDVLSELIKKSKKTVGEDDKTKFIKGSVLEKNLFKPESVNISIMSGVLSIFDKFETVINNLIRFTKKKGDIYIFALFNNYPIDVYVKYRRSENQHKSELESGWNIFSKDTVSRYLKKNKKIKKFYFKDFLLKSARKQNKKDYVRSWTFKDINKKNISVNGLNLMLPQSILHIELN